MTPQQCRDVVRFEREKRRQRDDFEHAALMADAVKAFEALSNSAMTGARSRSPKRALAVLVVKRGKAGRPPKLVYWRVAQFVGEQRKTVREVAAKFGTDYETARRYCAKEGINVRRVVNQYDAVAPVDASL